jgi:hypothetical protein
VKIKKKVIKNVIPSKELKHDTSVAGDINVRISHKLISFNDKTLYPAAYSVLLFQLQFEGISEFCLLV